MERTDLVANHTALATVSEASYACKSVIPSRSCSSSRSIGWSALLLDVHRGVKSDQPYRSIFTSDLRVGATLSGQFSCDYLSKGRWRQDIHTPGLLMLHHTSDPTSYRFPGLDHDYELALMYLPIGVFEAAHDHYRRIGRPVAMPVFNSMLFRDPAMAAVIASLAQAMRNGEDNLYAEATALWAAVHLLNRYGPDANMDDNRTGGEITDRRLQRVIEYVLGNFSQPVTLEVMASEACVSKYHFSRLFRQKTGRTPLAFLSEIRLGAAADLLHSTDRPVADIGKACGFGTASHFSSVFAAKYGMAPSTFRKNRMR